MATTIKKPSEAKVLDYDSNPFTLSFKALSNFFTHNAGWAIALMVLGLLGFVGNLVRAFVPSSGTTDPSVTPSTEAITGSTTAADATIIAAIVIVLLVLVIVFVLFATVIDTFVKGMFSYVALKSNEGKPVPFSEAFQATLKKFWTLFGSLWLANLKILGWTLLFIVPGIVAALRYSMLPFIVMNEQPSSIGDSHSRIKQLVKGRLWEVFGVGFVSGIIPIVGSILSYGGEAALYKQLQVYKDGNIEKPKIHWLNYLGVIVIILVLVLVASTAAMIFVLSQVNN